MRFLTFLVVLCTSVGCGGSGYESGITEYSTGASPAVEMDASLDQLVFESRSLNADSALLSNRYSFLAALDNTEVAKTDEKPADVSSATAGRKIIYNASVRLVVEDLSEFLTAVRKSVAEQDGFIGSSTETGMDGSNPSATLVVRVPSTGYGNVLATLDSLGTVEERSETSRDVTAQFVDVAARIRNKQREEERLIELLADATGKLVDILEVEKELSRVRGEIEQAQGQMNVLADQIGLATITINASERTVYTPPKPSLFGDRVSAAWTNSTTNLSEFFTRVSIEVVAFIPWLTVWIPILAVCFAIYRVVRRRNGRDVAGKTQEAS